ncbi:MAG: CRISPR-associated endonuclease Cas1 [Armatimonadetes bacterium]|nr:CRISPR-associated endonuclease Cas1 [Armatimonadota bacterium]
MASLYVVEHGATIARRGEQIVVQKEGEVLLETETSALSCIVLLETVQVTSQALTALLRAGVSFAFISPDGDLRGKLVPPVSRNAALRLAQFTRDRDPAFCLTLSKAIVAAKIENQRQVLLRHALDNPGPQDVLLAAASALDTAARKAAAAPDLPHLLGAEGEAAAAYWAAFPHLLAADGISFPGRRKRPPPDPVNAALSFGYTLLTDNLLSALDARGFDPWVGFLHSETYGHPCLALDLVEVFRAPVVDRFTVRLFNLRILTPDDFHPSEQGGVRMTPDALRSFFRHWEQTILKLGLRNIIKDQVDHLARVYLGQDESFKPWTWSAR